MRRPINWLVFSMSLLLLFANLLLAKPDGQSEPPRAAEMIVDPELARLRTYGEATPAVYVCAEKEDC